jgi:hypothetical protein
LGFRVEYASSVDACLGFRVEYASSAEASLTLVEKDVVLVARGVDPVLPSCVGPVLPMTTAFDEKPFLTPKPELNHDN